MDFAQIIQTVALYAIPVLFAITVHEAAHGYAARHFGDNTAHMLGRITLNPLKHIDPVGTIAMPLLLYFATSGAFLFGYAKPVPVNFGRLRNPKRDMVWVALAGPGANLVQAVMWTVGLYLLVAAGVEERFFLEMCRAGVLVNLVMFAFNLFPLPPLDGGRILVGLLPNHHRISRVVGVATSSGWFRGMRLGFRVKAHFGLRVAIPLGVRLKGYAPTALLGLGENLPATVGTQWGQWCAAGGYATNAVKGQAHHDFHAQVHMPITVFHATDDDIATPTTVADLLRTFPAAIKQVHHIAPRDHGLKRIGHIDWFRTSHQALWPLLAQALKAPH